MLNLLLFTMILSCAGEKPESTEVQPPELSVELLGWVGS